MGIGQRIAQKRKELGLSQEALGDQMGVSRQAIYKWESDAALPEIEKLVALSKLFGVSVGWLLGVEEDSAAEPTNTDSLNEAQLNMVEQIVDRYIQAQPKPKVKSKWLRITAALALVIAFVYIGERMEQIGNQYIKLQNSVSDIKSSINSQVSDLAYRVEKILKAQNNLTAESNTEIVDIDCRRGTVTISMKAVPKTFYAGMTAVFVADCGSGPVEYAATLGQNVFTAKVELPLTDRIELSVVFLRPDGVRQTQVLEGFSGLLTDSFPGLALSDDLHWTQIPDGTLALKSWFVQVWKITPGKGDAQIISFKVGIFRNQELIGWGELCEQPPNYIGDYTDAQFFRMPQIRLDDLQPGETLEIAALITDSYGRQFMYCDVPYVVCANFDGTLELEWSDVVSYPRDPSQWVLD